MQWEHVVMLATENFVADLDDQLVNIVVETLAGMVSVGGRLFKNGIRAYHLARDQIMTDAEMLERTLRLSSTELFSRLIKLAEFIAFYSNFLHCTFQQKQHDYIF